MNLKTVGGDRDFTMKTTSNIVMGRERRTNTETKRSGEVGDMWRGLVKCGGLSLVSLNI